MENDNIHNLIIAIEHSVGQKISTPRDFEFLSNILHHRTKKRISATTLKRIWGYISGYENTRPYTLNTLCQFIGYSDMDSFVNSLSNPEGHIPSHILLGEHIYTSDMKAGKCLRLTWAPERECNIKHEGEGRFVVLSSKLTKLIPGSTFCCNIIEKGRPMYINSLRFTPDQEEGYDYVAGLIGGIMYEVL